MGSSSVRAAAMVPGRALSVVSSSWRVARILTFIFGYSVPMMMAVRALRDSAVWNCLPILAGVRA